jgi:hypothetical protein
MTIVWLELSIDNARSDAHDRQKTQQKQEYQFSGNIDAKDR